MKRAGNLVCSVFAAWSLSVAGFAQTVGVISNGFINTVEGPMKASDYQRAKDEALAEAERRDQELMHCPGLITNRPPSEWRFPNYQTGPGRPLPVRVNFYSIDDNYPTYLMCGYDVHETNYSQRDESKWFEASLMQIRNSGTNSFPPVDWVVVIIANRAESQDQKCKVAVVFKAREVFDSSCDLAQVITNAPMDRHPFKYTPQQMLAGEHQRCVFVEQHAATNRTKLNLH
jgi:hypothetical protein